MPEVQAMIRSDQNPQRMRQLRRHPLQEQGEQGAVQHEPPSLVSSAPSLCEGELEDGMVGRDPSQLVIRRVRTDAVEEHPDLHLPLLQIGP